jgi:hypothetical protein
MAGNLFCVISVGISLRLDSQSDESGHSISFETLQYPETILPCPGRSEFSAWGSSALHWRHFSERQPYITSGFPRSNISPTMCQIFSEKRQYVRRFVLLATMSITGVVWLRVITHNAMHMMWMKDVMAFCSVLCRKAVHMRQTQQMFV